eukprot:6835392-Karenia_brevis.AAC.1
MFRYRMPETTNSVTGQRVQKKTFWMYGDQFLRLCRGETGSRFRLVAIPQSTKATYDSRKMGGMVLPCSEL